MKPYRQVRYAKSNQLYTAIFMVVSTHRRTRPETYTSSREVLQTRVNATASDSGSTQMCRISLLYPREAFGLCQRPPIKSRSMSSTKL